MFPDGEAEGGDMPAPRDCPSPSLQKTPTHAVSQHYPVAFDYNVLTIVSFYLNIDFVVFVLWIILIIYPGENFLD